MSGFGHYNWMPPTPNNNTTSSTNPAVSDTAPQEKKDGLKNVTSAGIEQKKEQPGPGLFSTSSTNWGQSSTTATTSTTGASNVPSTNGTKGHLGLGQSPAKPATTSNTTGFGFQSTPSATSSFTSTSGFGFNAPKPAGTESSAENTFGFGTTTPQQSVNTQSPAKTFGFGIPTAPTTTNPATALLPSTANPLTHHKASGESVHHTPKATAAPISTFMPTTSHTTVAKPSPTFSTPQRDDLMKAKEQQQATSASLFTQSLSQKPHHLPKVETPRTASLDKTISGPNFNSPSKPATETKVETPRKASVEKVSEVKTETPLKSSVEKVSKAKTETPLKALIEKMTETKVENPRKASIEKIAEPKKVESERKKSVEHPEPRKYRSESIDDSWVKIDRTEVEQTEKKAVEEKKVEKKVTPAPKKAKVEKPKVESVEGIRRSTRSRQPPQDLTPVQTSTSRRASSSKVEIPAGTGSKFGDIPHSIAFTCLALNF